MKIKINKNVSKLGYTYTIADSIDGMADYHFSQEYEIPKGWNVYMSVTGEYVAETPSGDRDIIEKYFKPGKDGKLYLFDEGKWYQMKYVEGSDGPEIYH